MSTPIQTNLYRSIQIQVRVVYALFMREIITRYGRHNIGFAWLFAEPMMFTSGVVALWTVVGETTSGHQINLIAFCITGYSTVLVWRNTIGRCTKAVEPNRTLLVHKNVRPIDFFIARIVLELAGTSLSAIAMLTIFTVLGLIPYPADILTMLWGWALLCWYSFAMALLIGGLSEVSEVVEKLWHPISYFQLPLSGLFGLASWLPPGFRRIVLLFPVPNAVEIFRYGYFGNSIQPIYDTGYTCTLCLLLTWLGLCSISFASKRLDAQ